MNRPASILLALSLTASLTSCDDQHDPVEPGSILNIAEETLRLRPGTTGQLTIRSGGTVSVEVRQSDVVTATPEGVVRAIAPGITWVVFHSQSQSDSVRVIVSLSDNPAQGIAFTVASLPDTLRLSGVSRIFEPMGGGRRWTQVMAAAVTSNPDELNLSDLFDDAQTMLILQLDSVQQPGFRSVPAWTVNDGGTGQLRLQGSEGAMVWVRDPDNAQRVHVYVPVSPLALEIVRSDRPQQIGPASGALVGRVSFEAAGLIVQIDETGTRIVGQVSTQTTNVYAEFSVAQRIQPLGGMLLSVAGGPTPSSEPCNLGTPAVAIVNGGLVLHGGGITRSKVVFNMQLWVGNPRVGDITINPVTVEELAARSVFTSDRSFAWVESGMFDSLEAGGNFDNLALSNGGTLRITRFDAPGNDTYGFLEATLTTRQSLILGGAPGATQDVTLQIAAPIAPTGRPSFIHQPSTLTNTREIAVGPGILRVSNGNNEVAGRVVETSVTPVANVPITLLWNGGSASVRTNEQGEFLFTGVIAGDYEVRFQVPAGYSLADGQKASYPYLNIRDGIRNTLPINLADSAGNGALRVIAGSSGTNTAVSGVEVKVRREGSTEIVMTMITGEVQPGSGMARRKIAPGRYQLEYVLPSGYRFVDGQVATEIVTIRKGIELFRPIGVIRQ